MHGKPKEFEFELESHTLYVFVSLCNGSTLGTTTTTTTTTKDMLRFLIFLEQMGFIRAGLHPPPRSDPLSPPCPQEGPMSEAMRKILWEHSLRMNTNLRQQR